MEQRNHQHVIHGCACVCACACVSVHTSARVVSSGPCPWTVVTGSRARLPVSPVPPCWASRCPSWVSCVQPHGEQLSNSEVQQNWFPPHPPQQLFHKVCVSFAFVSDSAEATLGVQVHSAACCTLNKSLERAFEESMTTWKPPADDGRTPETHEDGDKKSGTVEKLLEFFRAAF